MEPQHQDRLLTPRQGTQGVEQLVVLRDHSVETANREGKLVITAVREGSPAQTAGLNAEDELLAIAGFRVDARTLSERLLQWKPGDKVDVLIARRDAIRTLSLVLAEVPASWKLEIDPDAPPGAVKTREAWMG